MPIIANGLRVRRTILGNINDYNKNNVLALFHNDCFPNGIPGIFVDLRKPRPVIMISDLDILQELYVTKNKYFDKDEGSNPFIHLMGESILFQ